MKTKTCFKQTSLFTCFIISIKSLRHLCCKSRTVAAVLPYLLNAPSTQQHSSRRQFHPCSCIVRQVSPTCKSVLAIKLYLLYCRLPLNIKHAAAGKRRLCVDLSLPIRLKNTTTLPLTPLKINKWITTGHEWL